MQEVQETLHSLKISNKRILKELNEISKYGYEIDDFNSDLEVTLYNPKIYNYIDDYVSIRIQFSNQYPFWRPKFYVNGIDMRRLLNRTSFTINNSYKYNGKILGKYFNYGFKGCPCCESKLYNEITNYYKYTLIDYLEEVKKYIIIKCNKEKLILARKIMSKYFGFENENVYEFLVGEV